MPVDLRATEKHWYGLPHNFFQEGQCRHFAYIFQVVEDAV